MKVANILRKIFLSLVAAALVAAYLISVYVVYVDEAKAGTNGAFKFAMISLIPLGLFIVGLILGESKESWAHKLGIGMHLTVSIALLVSAVLWYFDRFIVGKTAGVDRFTIPAYLIFGGVIVYYVSFIFQAVESSLKAKERAAEKAAKQCQCECGCNCGCEEQPYEEQYEEQAPAQQQAYPPYPPYPPYGCYPAPMYGMPIVQPVVQPIVQQVQPAPAAEPVKEEPKHEEPKHEEPKHEEVKAESVMPEDDVHVAALMKWKKLYLEGIVTEREFIRKRDEILGLRRQ